MDDDISAAIHRDMKREADMVRVGATDPFYVMHETFQDGHPVVENEAMREQKRWVRSLKREEGRELERD